MEIFDRFYTARTFSKSLVYQCALPILTTRRERIILEQQKKCKKTIISFVQPTIRRILWRVSIKRVTWTCYWRKSVILVKLKKNQSDFCRSRVRVPSPETKRARCRRGCCPRVCPCITRCIDPSVIVENRRTHCISRKINARARNSVDARGEKTKWKFKNKSNSLASTPRAVSLTNPWTAQQTRYTIYVGSAFYFRRK